MANILGQFTDELGDVAKSVTGELAKLPGDIAEKALDSMGLKSSKPINSTPGTSVNPESASYKFDQLKDPQKRQEHARSVLMELAGQVDLYGSSKPVQKELSVSEKLDREKMIALENQERIAKEQSKTALPQIKSKPKMGVAVSRAKTKTETRITKD